jgi:subtilase family serine protease
VAGQQVGANSILNITLRNSGKAPAPATRLTICCKALAGGPCPTGLDSTLNVPPLGMNQLQGMAWPSMSSSFWSAGKYRLVLSLDPRNQIPESNELNNKLTLNVDITAPLHAISGIGGSTIGFSRWRTSPG